MIEQVAPSPRETAMPPFRVVGDRLSIVCTSGAALAPAEEARIASGLAAALPELKIRDYFRVRTDALRSADHIVTARSAAGDVVAILTSTRHALDDGRPFLHIGMNLIAAPLRRTALMRDLWRAHFEQVEKTGGIPGVLALRTYNPAAYVAMHTFARVDGAAMYPAIEGAQCARLHGLARAVAARVAPGCPFDADRGVLQRCGVPLDFYGEMPESGKRTVNEYFGRHLQPGDRMLCVLEIANRTGIERMLRALGCRVR